MRVIVDTSVWSLVLRRPMPGTSPHVAEVENLIQDGRVQMFGPIRQEILSGIRDNNQFTRLQQRLESFPDLPIRTDDYVIAARYFDLCRSKGIQGSNTDFLICAASVQRKFSIYTTDKDFERFARHLPIVLHELEKS